MAAYPVSDTVAAPVWRLYLQLAAVALLWGGTFIAGRLLATDLPPFTAASGRFAVAAILLWLLARLLEGGLPRLSHRQMLSTALLGCSGIFLYNLCFFSALADMPASRTALFVALNPALTALAAALLLRERLATRQWGGIALALAGAWIIISRGEPVAAIHDLARAFGRGELMMLGAVTSWAAYTLVGRLALAGLSPVAATCYATFWGLGMLLAGAASEWTQWSAAQVSLTHMAAIAYLGALGTVVAFVWYYQGVRQLGPARTAVFNNLVPVCGVGLGALMLGEPVTAAMAGGGALAIAGVFLTNRPHN